MRNLVKIVLLVGIAAMSSGCRSRKPAGFSSRVVFTSSQLTVTQLSENSFEHTSFLQTNDFGKVPCNGLIVCKDNEAIIFDTPTNDTSAAELIKWVKEQRHCSIKAIVPTHFHNDCLGGLPAFHEQHIPSYAYFKTIDLAREKGFPVPQNGFNDSLILKVGAEQVIVKFFGEGHTRDNVVGYYPAERILFGGCLIKELNADKGYLGDANVADWPATVKKVKTAYPELMLVVPGHGKVGDTKLLDYTMELFSKQ